MRHIFIINPIAGKKNATDEIIQKGKALEQSHHISCEFYVTKYHGHAVELARSLAETGETMRLYACGGDGTANEVARGILGFENAAMTVIPTGTGNDLLRNFGDGYRENFLNLESLYDAPVSELDVIACGDKIALTIACNGIDAEIGGSVHRYGKYLHGRSAYVASIVANFLLKRIGHQWKVTLDGREFDGDYTLVTVCNGRHYGGGSMPVPEARMDDGQLEVILIHTVSRLRFARKFSDYSKGDHHKLNGFAKVYSARSVTITSQKADIMTGLDGECFRSDAVSFTISPHKLRFFAPKNLSPNATAKETPIAVAF